MAGQEDANMSKRDSLLMETHEMWKSEMESYRSQVDKLQAKLMDVKVSIESSEEDAGKELAVLWGEVRLIATMLHHLKSKARIMAVPELAHLSCVVEQLEGVSLVEKGDAQPSKSATEIDLLPSDSPGEETQTGIGRHPNYLDIKDKVYANVMLQSIQMVTDMLESLVRRVTAAESETVVQKEKVLLCEEEIKRKAVQIENLSLKLEEMERFAEGTNSVLNEMRERIEELVEETTRQRQKAMENEEELSRVKREFESLKSYISTFTNVRETLLSSERQFQTIEVLFERLVAKTTQLEGEKAQKEVEVQKMMEENVRLMALLDKKEAQLLALNEQCKFMALNSLNI
ncbi:PREDICTED: rab11 family-interacting protein 3 [Tarenaya hassleriana]|uniref:rab11 family-interacting protein 3 n=1 Tax=Tarenaya hassleriana TaxID=28532 RepID=UPI00053C90D7|nr:PREDICTED: rab11 family-interacting protein 3 [Tarenaya hassleriana]XP_010531083.1 PREDICTED: rab11 family-interacting protein 3 [Tarenaya hassleriana]